MANFDRGLSGDMDSADIIALLRKRGWSLRRLSIHHGLHPSTLSVALRRAGYPRGEAIIAAACGVPVTKLWPRRSADRATRKQSRLQANDD